MKSPSFLVTAVFALATFAGSAHGSVYIDNFDTGYYQGDMDGQDGWETSDSTAYAGAIMTLGGVWGAGSASLGYVSPLSTDEVYLSHAVETSSLGSGTTSFSTLFQVMDSSSVYGADAAARDTFGFRLENSSGENLFSFYLNPYDQALNPQTDTAFNTFSWSTGEGTPTVALAGLSAQESFAYTFTINFFDAGDGVAGFKADVNGSVFSGMLGAGSANEDISKFGAFWKPLNGAAAPGSNFLIFDNVSFSRYSAWAAVNAGSQPPEQDYDHDGVANGVEYFMGQTGSSFTAMPGLDGTNTITWTKDPYYNGIYEVQTSPDLSTWTDVTAIDNGTSVSYLLPGMSKLFVRLVVTPN